VRWTGSLTPPSAGTIAFSFSMAHCSTCDDAETIKVWLDDKPVYDFNHVATRGRRAPTPPFDLAFHDTHPHALRIEYTHTAPHFGAGLTFNWKPPIDELRRESVAAAAHADVTIAFVGLSPELEGEEMPLHVDGFNGGDRNTIELPAAQRQLIAALAATGKPLILVLMNGSAVALRGAEKQAAAILEAWYPGESGGTAIADTLFGDNNPSGRLPITFYASTDQLPPFNATSPASRSTPSATASATPASPTPPPGSPPQPCRLASPSPSPSTSPTAASATAPKPSKSTSSPRTPTQHPSLHSAAS
jgi:beta-glucosidase